MHVVGEIVPLALVVTVSPINVIPVILLLFTRRSSAWCFLAGFVAGVASLLVAAVVLAKVVNLSTSGHHSSWAGIVKLALGVYLLVEAVVKFRGRPRDGASASMPKWMDGIGSFSPAKALATGALLGALNPKNVVVGVAAAATIAAASLPIGQEIGSIAAYVVIAVLGVAAPVVVAVFLGDRADAVLGQWRTWLERNNATVMSVLFAIFGVVLVTQGIQGI